MAWGCQCAGVDLLGHLHCGAGWVRMGTMLRGLSFVLQQQREY